MPNYFLAKTDPDTYSIEDFEREQLTDWNGVHSPQALQAIRSWQPGDYVLIYHSQGEASIVGLAKVVSEAVKDLKDPRESWYAAVKFIRKFPEEKRVTLKQIKASGLFQDFLLVRQGRLSTMACPKEFIEWLKKQGLELE